MKNTISLEVPVKFYMENNKYYIKLELRGYVYIASSETSYKDAEKNLQNVIKRNYSEYFKITN